jgi:hypothetical protein
VDVRCFAGKIKALAIVLGERQCAPHVFTNCFTLMTRTIFFSGLLLCSAALSGCDTIGGLFGSNEPSPLEIQNVGPSINQVLKPLPKNLVGDEDNKLYGFDELRPPREEDTPL